MLDKTKKYYVYAYLDPRKRVDAHHEGVDFEFEPFYIGKGNGDRDQSHLKEYCDFKEGKIKGHIHRKIRKIDNIFKANKRPVIVRLFDNIDEEEAYVTENILIETIGRHEDGGCLFNYRTGGYEGGSLGEESKKRISKSLEKYFKENDLWNYEKDCRIPWNKGVPMTSEAKENLRNHNLGKSHSKETVEKRAKSNKENWDKNKEERWGKMKSTMESMGYIRDNVEIGKKISESKKGNVIISDTQKKQISSTLKKKYKSGEIKPWNKGLKTNKPSVRRVKVVKFSETGDSVEIFDSMSLASKGDYNSTSIRGSVKSGKLYKGFKWMYYDEYVKTMEDTLV